MGTTNLIEFRTKNDAIFGYTYSDGQIDALLKEFANIDKKFNKIIQEIDTRIQEISNPKSLEHIQLTEWKQSISNLLNEPESISKEFKKLVFGSINQYFPLSGSAGNPSNTSIIFSQDKPGEKFKAYGNNSEKYWLQDGEETAKLDYINIGPKITKETPISKDFSIIKVSGNNESCYIKMKSKNLEKFAEIWATLPIRYAAISNLMNCIGPKQEEVYQKIQGDWSKFERCSLAYIEGSLRFFTHFIFGTKQISLIDKKRSDEEILERIENFSPTRVWHGNLVNILTLFHPDLFESPTITEFNYIVKNKIDSDISIQVQPGNEKISLKFNNPSIDVSLLREKLNENFRAQLTDLAQNWNAEPEFAIIENYHLQAVKTMSDEFQPIKQEDNALSMMFLELTWQTYRMKAYAEVVEFQAKNKESTSLPKPQP